ncbi:MAG: hypothetical protein PHI72_10085 [Atribacterota bacterium]|nr:hypothetical protein [Atribacterota bacterium]MDD5659006.1 hypothetical protein [Actinomycetota bacterium]
MNNQIQFTLTVNAGKWLIAKAISELKYVKKAVTNGTLLLFGGTTVSALTEILKRTSLRISGRITPRGTVTAYEKIDNIPHSIVIHKGKIYDLERNLESNEIIKKMGKYDVIITGANGYDARGNAVLMAGAYGMGSRGHLLATIYSEGSKIIIAAGLEKYMPGSVIDAINYAGRNSSVWSMGCSVGLVPLIGEIVNEIEAIKILTGIQAIVIGKGGINGAEGSSTMIAQGSNDSLGKLAQLIGWSLQKNISGLPESLKECTRGINSCSHHLGCCYKSGKLFKRII